MREWCKDNVCGNYGRNYGCPTADGTPDELINKAKQYSKAFIIQIISEINNFEGNEDYNDALEFHNMIEVGKLATTYGLKYVKDSKTVTYFGLILFDRI